MLLEKINSVRKRCVINRPQRRSLYERNGSHNYSGGESSSICALTSPLSLPMGEIVGLINYKTTLITECTRGLHRKTAVTSCSTVLFLASIQRGQLVATSSWDAPFPDRVRDMVSIPSNSNFNWCLKSHFSNSSIHSPSFKSSRPCSDSGARANSTNLTSTPWTTPPNIANTAQLFYINVFNSLLKGKRVISCIDPGTTKCQILT